MKVTAYQIIHIHHPEVFASKVQEYLDGGFVLLGQPSYTPDLGFIQGVVKLEMEQAGAAQGPMGQPVEGSPAASRPYPNEWDGVQDTLRRPASIDNEAKHPDDNYCEGIR